MIFPTPLLPVRDPTFSITKSSRQALREGAALATAPPKCSPLELLALALPEALLELPEVLLELPLPPLPALLPLLLLLLPLL